MHMYIYTYTHTYIHIQKCTYMYTVYTDMYVHKYTYDLVAEDNML